MTSVGVHSGVNGNRQVRVVGRHLRRGRVCGPPWEYRMVGADRFQAVLADRELHFVRADARVVAVEMISAGEPGVRVPRVGAREREDGSDRDVR